MKQKLISVVVPVFNNEKYVNRCIDSILNQTYENLEVILVDDGSTDGSIKICEDWKQKDKRIKIITQKNLGAAAARNNGAKQATGDFVSFVDNDDWLRPEMYETMINTAEKESADLVFCKFINVDEKYNRTYVNEINLTKENLKNPFYFFVKRKKKDVFFGNIACCNRILIKKDLLSTVKFNEKLSFNENRLFVLNLLEKTDKIAVANEHLYNHFNPSFDSKVYDEAYFESLTRYYGEVSTYFEKNSLDLLYLINYDYICNRIKSKIKNKNFKAEMKKLEETDEIFKTAIETTSDLDILKAAKVSSPCKLNLIYKKKWNLLKLFKVKI